MQTTDISARLAEVAPGISRDLRQIILREARPISCPPGYLIFGPGDGCEQFLIALQGGVRVEHMGASGRSVVLYRVEPGGTCVMTTSCLLAGTPYEAYGYAEGNVTALALPLPVFRRLIAENTEFRNLAFSSFAGRIIEIVNVVDELLTHRVDLKIAGWLAARPGDRVSATHQQIAGELGTAREVVSRTLKEFERNGWIGLARGEISLLDRNALTHHAAA